MLVFLSDVHLTDGSSGQTIKPTAFSIFYDNLCKLADTVSPLKELHLVLLGDIFDIIRSGQWLAGGNTIRPWDNASPRQEKIVGNILQGIVTNNAKALTVFDYLRQYAVKKGVPFKITYVIGNHDWLINRYQGCRNLVAGALGISSANHPLFPTVLFEPDYRVFARHGDIYDKFNYMGNRDASSIGDAVVIELLNRYPLVVDARLSELVARNAMTSAEKTVITDLLKELDNIRPLLDAPSWVLMVANKTENEAARRVIEQAWEKCVDDFFKVSFIKNQDTYLWPDTIDRLQIALQLSSHMSKKLLETVAGLKEKLFQAKIEGDYHKEAFAEQKVRSGMADFVLYGHTHDQLIVPMDQVSFATGDTQDKIYFNTGTWRKTWNRVFFDPANREFIGWHVLTYVAIFRPDENGDYNFEFWNSALG